jgi:MFS family permease
MGNCGRHQGIWLNGLISSIHFAHSILRISSFLPEHHHAIVTNCRGICRGFSDASDRGWLFGRIADRRGRKTSMLISVCMMCFGSLVIACLPGYATIGTWAPALLLLARLFQGLSVGGEYGTSATYMSEVAVEGKKGFYASFQYVTLIGGQLLAVLVVVALQQILSDEELHAWGWRIRLLLGQYWLSLPCGCVASWTKPLNRKRGR